ILKQYLGFYRDSNSLIEDYTNLEFRTHFFNSLWSSGNSTMLVSDWLRQIKAELLTDSLVEAMALMLPHEIKSFYELQAGCEQGGALEKMTLGDLALCGRSENSVFLGTLHSSKGLEFEAVIIPELEQGCIPRFSAKTDEEIAEQRRLLYVAITRAKRDVF